MFAAAFLLFVGLLMVIGTLYGVRRGKVMSPFRSASLHQQRWVLRGQPGFWPHAGGWLAFGAYLLYQAVRLIQLA